MADICDESGANPGVIGEVQSICLERDYFTGHFKEKEAVIK